MKKCARCKTSKPLDDFTLNAKAIDGRHSWCKDCCRDYMRGRKSDPEKRRAAAKASDRRHPERRLPPVKMQACIDCSAAAVAYDHHKGYGEPLTVEPVCSECHGRRSRKRGEHRGRVLDGRTWDEIPNRLA